MAQTIKLKRSAVAAKVPLTTDVALGELAINTFDGKIYFKKDSGTAAIVCLANIGEVVELTGNQTIGGVKTFSSDGYFNGIRIGQGPAGTDNLVVGSGAGAALQSGATESVFLGYLAGNANTTGSFHVAIGSNALASITTANRCVAIGRQALWKTTTPAASSVAVGHQAARYNTLGRQIAIGENAIRDCTTQAATVTITTAGTGGTPGTYTGVLLKYVSGPTATTYPTATVVVGAGGNVTSCTITNGGLAFTATSGTVMELNNTANAGNVTGFTCTLATANTGDANVGIGINSGISLTTGSQNVFVGDSTATATTTGTNNFAFGQNALAANTTGIRNVCMGVAALNANVTGEANIALGTAVFQKNTTGSNNIVVGDLAACFHANGTTNLTDPEGCVYIGTECRGFNNSDSNSIVIAGRTATARGVGEGANTTVLGNLETTSTKLFGLTTSQTNTATTNAVVYGLRTEHQSSGTPAIGIGTGIQFAAETSTNNTEVGATVEAVTTNVTNTTEAFDLLFRTMSGGAAAAERFRITSAGNVTLQGNTIRVVNSRTPASATAAGTTGEICWDASYIYVCTATNTWRRIAHATW